jgi:hypothetical protein
MEKYSIFPFEMKKPSSSLLRQILEWVRGLWKAMGLRSVFWKIGDDLEELSQRDASLYVCQRIVHDLACPMTVFELYDESEDISAEVLVNELCLIEYVFGYLKKYGMELIEKIEDS